ncbi:subtype A tannase [Arachnia propionica]|uniref:subtype A tannase n=1 Tax=Arachnia propionica TaxID=1750 RepID=UPI0030CD3249
MDLSRRSLLTSAVAFSLFGGLGLTACASRTSGSTASSTGVSGTAATGALALNSADWSHDAINDVYYQIGLSYVTSPAAPDYETLGIYVPGAYFTGTDNGDGAYEVTVNASGSINGFTPATAPIVLPVNTPGYASQKPPTQYSYESISEYMAAGFIYVHAGLRGKDSNADSYVGNAPWGVTDLKAAVRYLRYNSASLPGSMDRIFVFGHSGGGAQSSVMGTSGDSPLYTTYLEHLGAAMTFSDGTAISDAIAGVMAWCPITSLNVGNAAYEWNMGQFASSGTRAEGTWTAAYSKDLAAAFAETVNGLGLTDSKGTALKLERNSEGVYLAGSYYDHVVAEITTSLNNFLADTTFPYTPSSRQIAGMEPGSGGGGPSGQGATPPSGEAPGGQNPGGESSGSSTTYATVEEYIAYLNGENPWVTYDSASNTATITGLQGFVTSQKNPSKDVGAFDAPDRSATENIVMGKGTQGLHFSKLSRDVLAANESTYSSLTGWSGDYAASMWETDFATTDEVGGDVVSREQMYEPLYYLLKSQGGQSSSRVAPNWRIRSGITQGDAASTVEINLALALQALGGTKVDFATVWGQGHTMAERSGDATANFISWVKDASS